MADGQIDPARLNGDALTQWCLRSPAEIEEEIVVTEGRVERQASVQSAIQQ